MSDSTVIRRNGFTNESLDWRSWLTPLDPQRASVQQLEVLDQSHAQARTSEYYLTLAHQPLMLRHRSEAYNAIMYAPGGLPRAERELGAMVVSVTNGCVYCTSVHAQRFAQLARRSDTVEAESTDDTALREQLLEAQMRLELGELDEAAFVEIERDVLARMRELRGERQGAFTLVADDMQALHAVGLSDPEIIDLLHAVAIFGWANRLMHNLGEPVLPAD